MFATMEFIKITMHYLGINNSKDVKLSDKKLISFGEQLKTLLSHHLGPFSFYHSAGLIDKGARHRAQRVLCTSPPPPRPFIARLQTAPLMSPTQGLVCTDYVDVHGGLIRRSPKLREIKTSLSMLAHNGNPSIHEAKGGRPRLSSHS